TEGAVAMISGAASGFGYDASYVAPGKRVFVSIMLILLYLAMTVVFYFMQTLFRQRSEHDRVRFLAEIGTQPFDVSDWKTAYLTQGEGKREFIWFACLIGAGALATLIGRPLTGATILLMAGQLPAVFLIGFLPLTGIAARVVQALAFAVINLLLFRLYQTVVLTRLYAGWAGERMHVEKHVEK
ncbi:MAG: hypothetical protein IKL84_03830, partial [Clostridia bacterium]|nr:hypothetical protein [Clostridia bacterium]